MRRSILISILILFAAAAPAAVAQAPDHVASAPGAARHPDDDGLIVRQAIRVSLGADGRVERRVESALKMLTAYLPRHDHYDPRIPWNDARSTLRIDRVRTWMADGALVDAKANSVVPNTADELAWAVPYAHMRQKVVAHVGVEHGATSELVYTIADRRAWDDPFQGVLDLQGLLPILEQEITIEVPEGTPLRIAGIGCELEPVVESADGRTTYTVRRKDVPAVNPSELTGDQRVHDRLAWSVLGSWEHAARLLAARCEEAIRVDETVESRARDLARGLLLPEERIGKLHDFVVEGLRTVDWPIADFAFEMRRSGAVLDSSVGHPLDKAVLLLALLRSEGFDSRIALASADPLIAEGVAAWDQLDRVWVRVRFDGRELWLDPTASADERNRLHLAGLPVLVLDWPKSDLVVLPELSAEENGAVLRITAALEPHGEGLALSGTADLDLFARYNPVAAYDRTANRQAAVARGVVGALGRAAVDEVFVARQSDRLSSMRVEFSGGEIPVPRHGLVRLSLPRVPGGVTASELQLHRKSRTAPLRLPRGPATETVQVDLRLPEGFELVYAPPETAILFSVGSLTRSVELEGRTLRCRTRISLESAEVPPGFYPELREMIAALESEAASTLLLRRVD